MKYSKNMSIIDAIKEFDRTMTQSFEEEYSEKIGETSVSKILDFSDKIITNSEKYPNSKTLIMGNVQSGKTATYFGLIAKYMDSHSNFSIIIPAIDNVLYSQTHNRLSKVFRKNNVTIYRATENNINDPETKADIIKRLKNNEKVIILSLKNSTQLSKVIKLANDVNKHIKKPIIFDDEGDQASFNDVTKDERTTTNRKIIELIKEFKDSSFFTITATPMAQIFVDKEEHIKPDFAFVIEPGDGYAGLNYYHKISDRDFDYSLREIKVEDVKLVNGKQNRRPDSFNETLLYYFSAAAYFQLKNKKLNFTSCLFHTHRKNDDHGLIKKWIDSAKDDIDRGLRNKRERIIDSLKKVLDDSVMEIKDNEFNLFIELIIKHIGKSKVVIGNQSNDEFKTVLLSDDAKEFNTIYIGSQMLQRGVTLPNLITTYFTYRSKGTANADTVLQRARWFGYRGEYKELTRVYMSKTAMDDFNALADMNTDLMERLKTLEEDGLNFKNSFESSILVPYINMRATRQTVAKNGRNKLWRTYKDAYASTSSEPTEQLYERVKKSSETEKLMENQNFIGIKFEKYSDALDWVGIEINSIYKELGLTGHVKVDFEDFIEKENMSFVIAIMNSSINDDGIRYRTTNGKDKNEYFDLMQGRNNNYIGDAYWFKDKTYEKAVVLQIHRIKKKDSTDNTIYYKTVIVSPKRVIGELIHKL